MTDVMVALSFILAFGSIAILAFAVGSLRKRVAELEKRR